MTRAGEPIGGFQRLSDLAREATPLQWLVEPLLTTDALGLIAAPPKSFKSWMVLSAAVSVATDTPWLGWFPVRRSGPVVLVSPEGGVAGLVQRADAVARSVGSDVSELDIAYVRTRSLALTERGDLADLRAAVGETCPALVLYDSIFAGLANANTSRLSEFGAALRAGSDIALEAGAAFVASHHLNRQEGSGLQRVSGAGPAEWASAILLGSAGPKMTIEGTSAVTINWSLTARDVPETEFSAVFRIDRTDSADLASPLTFDAHVSVPGSSHGAGPPLDFVEQRVLDVLNVLGPLGGSVQTIGDGIARDGRGKPLRRQTLWSTLDGLIQRGIADGADGHWWAIPIQETHP